MEPKQEIEQLTRELEHAGYLYYVLDNPEMSDYDYDHKLRRLEELEAQYPQYGFAVHKGYGTKRHYEALREFGPSPIHRKTFLKKFYENP